jgi:hypothetical protein
MPIVFWLKLAGWAAGAAFLFWLVDEIGDRREAKVRAEYDQAIVETNADIGELNTAESKIAAVAAAARATALAEAAKAKGGKHPASQEQADALNRISARRGR